MERGLAWLLEHVPDRPVIYIPGNHEFYGADIDRTIEKARLAAEGSNIHVLSDEAVVIDGVRFLCGTLWTDFTLLGNPQIAMAAAASLMNDYKHIRCNQYSRRLTPAASLARHHRTRSFLERELDAGFEGPTVVVTHHAPHPGGIVEAYRHDLISAAYASDLTDLISRTAPDLWIYGHTHRCEDAYLGQTRMISNAKGYGPWHPKDTWENRDFDPLKVIELVR